MNLVGAAGRTRLALPLLCYLGTLVGKAATAAAVPACEGDGCQDCAPGRAFNKASGECQVCSPGSFQNSTGASECIVASPGWYVNDTDDPIAALLCPQGHECPEAGMVVAHRCPAGSFTSERGLSACLLCSKGSFQRQRGSTSCQSCESVLAGSTTRNIASTAASQCICPPASFRPEGQEECVSCLEGMQCDGEDHEEGSGADHSQTNLSVTGARQYPLLVQEGYMSVVPGKYLQIYRCQSPGWCPGGEPGSCAEGRDPATIACGGCLPGRYAAGETCKSCGQETWLPIILAAVAGSAVVSMVAIHCNMDLRWVSQSALQGASTLAMTFLHLQALALVHQMEIPWLEPMKTVLSVASLFSIDLELLQLGCSIGVRRPAVLFAVRLWLPILATPLVVSLALWVKSILLRSLHRRSFTTEFANSSGMLCSVFFIALLRLSLDPFICYRHPDGNGESVVSAPAILCFESEEHSMMMMMGFLALLFILLPFLAGCIYGIQQYPRRVNLRDGSVFLHRFRFLFLRCHCKRHYFHLVLLGRSALVCLIPVAFCGEPSTQVLFMCLVLGFYGLLVAQLKPWRFCLCNPMDSISNFLLSFILTAGALFLEDVPQRQSVTWLAFSAVISLVAFGLGGVIAAALRYFMPHRNDFFICHHKADAAAQARFLKILLQNKGSADVFIDSDNLSELDLLFDHVKSRVKTLLVYLTSETLRRTWCAGEIATAFGAGVAMVRIVTPSFVSPSTEQLEVVEHYINPDGCNLSEYGIPWADITKAYLHLLAVTEKVEWNLRMRGTQCMECVAAAVLKQQCRTGTDSEQSNRSTSRGGAPNNKAEPAAAESASIVISFHTMNEEASASAGILAWCLSQHTWQSCGLGFHLLGNYEHSLSSGSLQNVIAQAPVVVVLLSQGCLEDSTFVAVICEIQSREAGAATLASGSIPVHTPDFCFPCAASYRRIAGMTELQMLYGDAAVHYLERFFKTISTALPTHASQDAISCQVTELQARIKSRVVTAAEAAVKVRRPSISSLTSCHSSSLMSLTSEAACCEQLQEVPRTRSDASMQTASTASSAADARACWLSLVAAFPSVDDAVPDERESPMADAREFHLCL